MRKPLIDDKGNVRELLDEDFAAMRPAREVLPPELYARLIARKPGQRGAQKGAVKRLVSLRLDKDVIEGFRSKGSGWQTQINDALREWLAAH